MNNNYYAKLAKNKSLLKDKKRIIENLYSKVQKLKCSTLINSILYIYYNKSFISIVL